jgi:hypothetical protein
VPNSSRLQTARKRCTSLPRSSAEQALTGQVIPTLPDFFVASTYGAPGHPGARVVAGLGGTVQSAACA